MKNYAVILAAGKGKRMESSIPKQYLDLCGRPVIYYALEAFQKSRIDEIIVVVPEGEEEDFKRDIVEQYIFSKVRCIVHGGHERYASVYNGLKGLKEIDCNVCSEKCAVLIHDGARPLITPEAINNLIDRVYTDGAVVAGTLSKDTVQICDDKGFITATPDRKNVWIAQTPQGFTADIVIPAYEKLLETEGTEANVTDDAMVVRKYAGCPVKMTECGCINSKITTKEDLAFASFVIRSRSGVF